MEIASSSSKVTVEYHDPAGIFPLVARDIQSRLPLRNLNWQSPPRPLRQIKSLHVELVPDKETQDTLRPSTSSRADSDKPNSVEIVHGGVKHAVKERRHQIPGFRTSAYLKIYILRCDDKESYKEDARQKIREWIKENAQPHGKREDHDAFEWLILHVVIPDTVAASEPRWRESANDPDELRERKGGKLIGKNTRTVFDRLRADFNESGKTSQDRVAQIRLTKDRVPADLLPTPAIAQTLEETPQERENGWNHLISKVKTLILGPFDRRVRQYEADIAEQEMRRSLPGWNFCTFFIHKEGLAKALESIGLAEDALAIYDELGLGLENVLRDIASGQVKSTATSFASFTDDIEQRISGLPGRYTNGSHDDMTNEKYDAGALFNKDYRERIVRSDISVFDFFCYIFTRQKALVLRLANARSARIQLGAEANREGGEDLVLTSEVCWRASNFIHNSARALRQDLANKPPAHYPEADASVTESLVCSWIWSVAGQVLEETAVPALLGITDQSTQDISQGSNGQIKRQHIHLGLGANTHPQRTTSLPGQSAKVPQPVRPRSERDVLTHGDSLIPNGTEPELSKPLGIPGQADLATYRTELTLARRKALEQLARARGWQAGWAFANYSNQIKFNDVNLDDGAQEIDTGGKEERETDASLSQCPGIRTALQSENEFQSTFERLTDSAIRHYVAATQSKSAETLLGDLAILKFQQGEYEASESYFQHILPLISSERWSLVETRALSIYSRCLRKLEKYDLYVQNGLKLLGKIIAKRIDQQMPKIRLDAVVEDNDDLEAPSIFGDVLDASRQLEQDVVRPIKGFFQDVYLSREIMHDGNSDIFSLSLRVRHMLEDAIELTSVKTRLVSHSDPAQEVWVANDGPVTLRLGLNEVELKAAVVAHGPFLIDKIVLTGNRVNFVEELRPPPEPTPLSFAAIEPSTVTTMEPGKLPAFVFLYPAEGSFSAEVRRSKSIHINKPRRLEVLFRSGRNKIDVLKMKLKSTSAGLRLHLADADSSGIEFNLEAGGKGAQLTFGKLQAESDALVSIPFTVEQATPEVSVRLEIIYNNAHEQFVFLDSVRMSNEMPLDVDVNDVFHLDALFSNFTVRTTTRTPFAVLDAQLDESPLYSVVAPMGIPFPLTVFTSQPMNLVYKIARKPMEPANNKIQKRDAALVLVVRYQSMDSILANTIEEKFLEDIRQSQFSNLRRLLLPLILERSRQHLQKGDLEMAALIGEFRTPEFDDVGWLEAIRILPEGIQLSLETWLRQWHTNNGVIPALVGEGVDATTEQISISVDVPNIDLVFSTSFNLRDSAANTSLPILTLGEPVHASISVKHTSNWSVNSVFQSLPTLKKNNDDESRKAFVCDIAADSDSWLIGGPRRYHFTPQNGEENLFNVILVPMRLGNHDLPLIEVHQGLNEPEGLPNGPSEEAITCETHYEGAGQAVRVVRDVRTICVQVVESPTFVALPASRPGTASNNKEAG